MQRLIIVDNVLEETIAEYACADVREKLIELFPSFPATARLYSGSVSHETDVTPKDASDVARLSEYPVVYMVVYPADPGTITIIAVVVAVLLVGAAMLLKPKTAVPNVAARNTQSTSPNNELSQRTNKARPACRIPDIYGQVRATPDLLALPYTTFVDHQEVEHSFMCIGRGSYLVSDICDDTTLAENVPGTSVAVYAPYTSPNSGDAPQVLVGAPINEALLDVVRANSVNGQVLRPPNDVSLTYKDNTVFSAPDRITVADATLNFTDRFEPGDTLTIYDAIQFESSATVTKSLLFESTISFSFSLADATIPEPFASALYIRFTDFIVDNLNLQINVSGLYKLTEKAVVPVTVIDQETQQEITTYKCTVTVGYKWFPAGVVGNVGSGAVLLMPDEPTYIFDGTYTVASVSDNEIRLNNPGSVNAVWSGLSSSNSITATLKTSGLKWVGPFIADRNAITGALGNFVALNGMYKDNGEEQFPAVATVMFEATLLDAHGAPTTTVYTAVNEIKGSAVTRATRAATVELNLPEEGRYRFRACRFTPSDTAFAGSVVDEVKWRDLFTTRPIPGEHFGNVTTVQSRSYATAGALALKERKLNMLVTRRLPKRLEGDAFSAELYATKNAADILCAICLDQHIGRRALDEIDVDGIYAAHASVVSYFGTSKAGEFSYTFDSDGLSFEEMANTVAEAIFCNAYRRGNVLRLSFERSTDNSVLLLNHRNKLPGSETRTVSFGNVDDYDGVEYEYVDPADDAVVTLYLPEDRSALKPKKIESVGVRNRLQAYFHAYRILARIRYQNTAVEFTATQEAAMLVNDDRILVADNTRTGTQDGEVVQQDGLTLLLSQKVSLTGGDTLYIQHYDGSVEALPVSAGPTADRVNLSRPPRLALVTDPGVYARTTYILVGNTPTRSAAFLVAEKQAEQGLTYKVTANNYDPRYYAHDLDFINGVVNENGE